MARIALDLNKAEDRVKVGGGVWRQAMGLVPGEPNQGLVAELEAAPPRLADFDDSDWQISNNIREPVSKGLHLRLVADHGRVSRDGRRPADRRVQRAVRD